MASRFKKQLASQSIKKGGMSQMKRLYRVPSRFMTGFACALSSGLVLPAVRRARLSVKQAGDPSRRLTFKQANVRIRVL